ILRRLTELWDLLTLESQEREAEFEDTSEHFMILLSTEAWLMATSCSIAHGSSTQVADMLRQGLI
ncbi:hypothetical protein ACJX0J_020433, partial [Zea mays]